MLNKTKINPLVSIIVPFYNSELYINACIDSIIEQTYINFELILVDDGSTDNSLYICEQYALIDDRIRVFHQSNSGVSIARNYGLNFANGQYVLFIDSDDTVRKEYLSQMVLPTTVYDYDLVICNISDVFQNTIRKKRKVISPLTGRFKEDYYNLKEVLRGPVVKLYKKQILNQYNIDFPPNVKLAEDQLFNFSYFKFVQTYYYIDEGLYNYYHRRRQSLSELRTEEAFKDIQYKLQAEQKFLIENDISRYDTIMNDHTLLTLRDFILGLSIDSYFYYKKNWNELSQLIYFNEKNTNIKRRILLFLLKNNLHVFVFTYYILQTYWKRYCS